MTEEEKPLEDEDWDLNKLPEGFPEVSVEGEGLEEIIEAIHGQSCKNCD